MHTRNAGRLHIIDLLRFIAAFSVMVYHFTYRAPMIDHIGGIPFPELDWWTRYLHLGVRLFFMISGFVICYSADGKTALQFAWSRVVRLYPAYLLCVTLTFFVCREFWQPYFTLGVKDWLVNLTMMQEYMKVEHVDPPYWTLTEELHFYALMFMLLLTGQSHRRLLFVTVWMLLSGVDYFIKVPLARYEMTLEHAPFFAAGMVFYDMFKHGVRVPHWPLLGLTFSIGLARFLRWSDIDGREMHAVCSPVVITVILASMYVFFILVALRKLSLPESRWLAAAGGITYPLYLIHDRIGLTLLHKLADVMDRWLLLPVVMGGMCAVAFAIWRFYEQPVMRSLQAFGRRQGL